MTLGDVLKAGREAADMTQRQVAERMDVTRARVQQIESGDSGMRVETAVRYARAIGGRLRIELDTPKRQRQRKTAGETFKITEHQR